MIFDVRVGDFTAKKIASEYGPERTATGQPSEWDFWSGPLAAALIGFRDFENVRFDLHPELRTLHVFDPMLGPVLFAGVLVEPGLVEIADFEIDPDYWKLIEDTPND